MRTVILQGLVNVPIEHRPSIGDIISNRYLKVMFKIPKKGHLPTPVLGDVSQRFTTFRAETLERSPPLTSPGDPRGDMLQAMAQTWDIQSWDSLY